MIQTFPDVCPDVPASDGGWLCRDVQNLLSRFLHDDTHTIVEIGTWMGKSTRWMLGHAPNATIYCVDHWQGSREHRHRKHAGHLPTLYETFIASSWQHRDRIRIVRHSSRVGLPLLASQGVTPDLIYVDGSHEYLDVLADIADCNRLFPVAPIVGDDWNWHGVQQAVQQYSADAGRKYETHGRAWCMP